MGAVLAAECERARNWVSLGLDGELSQVEQALVRAHVGRCAGCADFARDLHGLTQELRRAPLERPSGQCGPVRRRRPGMRALQLGAAAAAVVLAATLGSLVGSFSARQPAALTAAAPFPLHAFRVAQRPAVLPGTRMQSSTPV
jgi:anti-sigma factor RsiW